MLLKEYVKNGTKYKKDLKINFDPSAQKYQYLVMNVTLDVWLPGHFGSHLLCWEKLLFSFQLAKKQMGSIFGEENIENFSINIHIYLKSSSMS